ncbi:MAG: TonB-dependent receptor [Saprospiraceae bacterium]
MNKTFLTLFVLGLWAHSLFAQRYTISGYILDESSGENLLAANVYESNSGSGTTSNTYGFFSLTLPADTVNLHFSYIGYQAQNIRFDLKRDTTFTISLSSSVSLATVEVTAERLERIEESSQMSRMEVPVEQIKKLPSLLGEVDVLKTLQLLPGVQSGGEGQTGLYVRGGSPDQNLVLLDGVPVYNVSHLLGIFSVFNADAIKNVTLTKGGFPARFGGRLSSILEINMKEGNLQEFHGEGSIGLISSKLTLEGPIKKGKTAFLIAGRRTYADLVFGPIIKASQSADTDLKVKLFFYDLNAKFQHKINDKHRLFLSAYLGADVFGNKYNDLVANESYNTGIDWGNLISALRWNWQLNNKLFANTTLTYSRYKIDFFIGTESGTGNDFTRFDAKYLSGIQDQAAKIDFDYIPNPKHYIRFGASATNHEYNPGALALKNADPDFNIDTLLGSSKAYSTEYSVYVEDDMKLGALKANLGLHASAFNVEGKWYSSLQPRLGLRYLMSNNLAVKASFSTMWQYINLLTSESINLPTDLWVPSTQRILPQQSWQAALGVARTFKDQYEISVEGYYKKMHNVLSYKEGSSFLFGFESDWQDKVTQGDGESYGLELFLQKKKGRTAGWIGYTLSWNWRQFDEINNGKRFPFRYDRRHDLSIVLTHELTDRITFSSAWVFGSGNAITLPLYRYPVDAYTFGGPNTVPYFDEVESGGDKNAFRMSDYHRLDVSITFSKKKPKWERQWVIGVYNAYYHRNPYYVISDEVLKDGSYQRVFKEISVLPIIPSVAYNFKF